jgi:ComF family protein
MGEIKDTVLGIVYPGRCPICDDVTAGFGIGRRNEPLKRLIHDECLRKAKFVRGAVCLRCGKPLGEDSFDEYCTDCRTIRHVFDRGFSVFEYRSISGSVYRFKYMGRQEYAGFYGKATKKRLGRILPELGIEAIVPVPMYRDKEMERGYNQAEVYARAVSAEFGIPLRSDLISRVRNTVPMKKLDLSGRRNNLKKAFIVHKNDVKFKCILIVDDIYTTGSTIDEIAHEFRMAGVEKIYFLTLAIGQTT